MITYVNTVLVGTGVGTLATNYTVSEAEAGKYIIVDNDGTVLTTATAATAEAIKVGLKTENGIKWSNIIKKADVKSFHYAPWQAETEDAVKFTFTQAAAAAATEDIRVVIRLTFKDMDTRYRKWSESFEVFAKKSSTAAQIATAFKDVINGKDAKRARVTATTSSNDLILTAIAYKDDNSVDSISPANKVRFIGNAWYTRPEADGFESKNKYNAATVNKTPGVYPAATWKLVRDAEAQAMGYQGILNRGEGTWPIIKPEMNVVKNAQYESVTLEFENMYRTADDLQRRTKQALQIFEKVTVNSGTATSKIAETVVVALKNFIAGAESATAAQVKANTSDVKD